jgi:hypothetical protein
MATILSTTGATWRTAKNSETGDEIEFFEFNEANSRKMSVTPGTWVVQTSFGETIDGIANLQRLKDGDFVCRQVDHLWVMNGPLFAATYEHQRAL